MQTVNVPEDEFFEYHEELKKHGLMIVRCLHVASKRGRYFQLTFTNSDDQVVFGS